MNIDDEEMMPKILSTSNTKELKMFVLSAITVFSCAKIAETLFSSKNEYTSWGDESGHAHPNKSFQASSQARFLRAHTEAKGSHTWGF
tara:strand:- start:4895 stop:5158 length:264 start_codon:yes stop_codon:yes gene_type:complete